MFELEKTVDKILKEGVPFTVEFDPLSLSYMGLALFLALFAALTMWSLAQKAIDG